MHGLLIAAACAGSALPGRKQAKVERVRAAHQRSPSAERSRPRRPPATLTLARIVHPEIIRQTPTNHVWCTPRWGVASAVERVIWGCSCIKPYQGPGPFTANAQPLSGRSAHAGVRTNTGAGMRQVRHRVSSVLPVASTCGPPPMDRGSSEDPRGPRTTPVCTKQYASICACAPLQRLCRTLTDPARWARGAILNGPDKQCASSVH